MNGDVNGIAGSAIDPAARNAFIAGLPKAELHMHLEGSLEPALLLDLAARNGVAVPYDSVDDLAAAYDFENLQAFLDIYYLGLTVLQTGPDFHDMTLEYLRRAAVDNVRHAEVFISPQAHTKRGLAMETVVESILAAFETAASELGVTGGLILGLQRQFSEDDAFATIEASRPYRDRVLGLGLGGPEIGNPPEKFTNAFAAARDLGWKSVAHAGEEGGADYVAGALDALKVDRIDHGVRCEGDPALVRRLADEGVPLTVCPLSNVSLKVFPDMASHNIKRLFDAGLHVTVNSDDPPYFGGYVGENYVACADALGFTDAELYRLAHNGFTASFADPAVRDRHLAELDGYVAACGLEPLPR